MTDFATLYLDFFQTIGCPLRPQDGIVFPEAIAAPLSVRQFYEVAGNAEEWTQIYNRFLAPTDWEGDEICVFLEENQGVMLWGFRGEEAHLDDPEAYYATYEHNSPLQWEPMGASCSQLIFQTVAMQPFDAGEQILFASADKTDLTPVLAEKIAQKRVWRKVAQLDESLVYIQNGALLCHLDWVDGPTLFCGTHSKKHLREIGKELGVKWDGGLF